MKEPANSFGPGESLATVRVRYPETDRMGVVYHAHYLVWFELGRTELMRGLGCSYGELEDVRGIFFPVTEAGVKYLAPAHYDDVLQVGTRLVSVGGARARFSYRLIRPADGKLLVTGFTGHAAVGRDGRPLRLPGEIRETLQAACTREGEEP